MTLESCGLLMAAGTRSSAGYRPSFGSDSISAKSAASCFEVEAHGSARLRPQHDYTAIRAAPFRMDRPHRSRPKSLWHTFAAANKSNVDLIAEPEIYGPYSSCLATPKSKAPSVGIEVDDALAIAEQVDVWYWVLIPAYVQLHRVSEARALLEAVENHAPPDPHRRICATARTNRRRLLLREQSDPCKL